MKGKTTDTIQSIEQKILVEYEILKDPNVGKERKKKATKNLKNYEQHLRNVDDKYLNGKHYPERMKGFPDNEPMDKKELFKLIDSVYGQDEASKQTDWDYSRSLIADNRDLQGLMI